MTGGADCLGADAEERVFRFKELSAHAKARARSDWREAYFSDSTWAEFAIEDIETVAAMLGIKIRRRKGERSAIYWQLYCQGSGLCFEGEWRSADAVGCFLRVKDHASQDETLHNIAFRLAMIQWPGPYNLCATVTHSDSNYYHENTMRFEIVNEDAETSDDELVAHDIEEKVEHALKDFAKWAYRLIEAEDEYQSSDEHIDEALGDYEFDEDGEIVS